MWLGSFVVVTVAVAGGYSSDLTPRLGTSICLGCGPKKTKRPPPQKRNYLKKQWTKAERGRADKKDKKTPPPNVDILEKTLH